MAGAAAPPRMDLLPWSIPPASYAVVTITWLAPPEKRIS
jgi:hypothetical protein